MPPWAIILRVWAAMCPASASSSRAAMRSRNSRVMEGGNLGALPKPPRSSSKVRVRPAMAFSNKASSSMSSWSPWVMTRVSPSVSWVAFSSMSARCSCQARLMLGEQLGEAGHVVAGRGREVGAAEKRPSIGREEDGHGPAAMPGHGDDGVHVDAVEVGAFFAVYFDVDEMGVHGNGRFFIFKGFVGHHMAPVAGGVADTEQDGFVLCLG